MNRTRFVLKWRTVRPRRAALAAILAAVLLLGCDGGPCKATVSPLTNLDAGQASCARAEDCPLSGNLAVCTDSGEPNLPTESCVRCNQNLCVKYVCPP